MNEAAKQTFIDITGYEPSIFYDFFTWVLTLMLLFMVIIVIMKSDKQRRNDRDYHEIDMLIDILRAAGLAFFLILIFT